MKKICLFVLLLLATAVTGLAETGEHLLLQRPAVSQTAIAFVFAGDLWVVGREGGEARRLTTGTGIETTPYFSPDGTMIAFTGQYDGNTDVYVMPSSDGVPRRLTWHPLPDVVTGWTPDGKQILFRSFRDCPISRQPYARLYTIAVDGVFPTALPLPMGYEGAYSPDGARVAFFSPKGEWEVENRGIAPDIEVDLDPQAWRAGRDPQLEKAVEVVMEALRKNPPPAAGKPAYPNYHRSQGQQ